MDKDLTCGDFKRAVDAYGCNPSKESAGAVLDMALGRDDPWLHGGIVILLKAYDPRALESHPLFDKWLRDHGQDGLEQFSFIDRHTTAGREG